MLRPLMQSEVHKDPMLVFFHGGGRTQPTCLVIELQVQLVSARRSCPPRPNTRSVQQYDLVAGSTRGTPTTGLLSSTRIYLINPRTRVKRGGTE